MVTKTATRPSPRPSLSHSQSYRSSKASTTPVSPLPRDAVSVGQPLPPSTLIRSPGIPEGFATTPNYFGLVIDHAGDTREAGGSPRNERSVLASSVLSFDAGSPRPIAIVSHTEHEVLKDETASKNAFKDQSFSYFTSNPGADYMCHSLDGKSAGSEAQGPWPSPKTTPAAHSKSGIMDHDAVRDSAYSSSSELRLPSDSSMDTASFSDESPTNVMSPIRRHALSHLEDRHRRFSSPTKVDPRSPQLKLQSRGLHARSTSVISGCDDGPITVAPAQLKDMIERLSPSEYLLLDLRVFPNSPNPELKTH